MAGPSAILAIRNAYVQAILDQAGNGAKLKYYNGARPGSLGALSGNTLLATVTGPAEALLATVSGGEAPITGAGYTQDASTFVAGTPVFVDITKADNTVVYRVEFGALSNQWPAMSAIAPNVPIAFVGCKLVAADA